MNLFRAGVIAVSIACIFGVLPVSGAEPPHAAFVPVSPGVIVKSQLFYPAGEAMHSQWRAVMSKQLVGKGSTQSFYQYYLSIYQLDGNAYKLRYQSPRDGGPFTKLSKASGAELWFPFQSGTIVGAGEFMRSGVQQVVVATHQTGADCGSAAVSVFGVDPTANKVVPEVSVQNGCDLNARVVAGTGSSLASLLLTGPYYAKNAALCCPTKPNASATLRYQNGRWVQAPKYYEMSAGRLASQ